MLFEGLSLLSPQKQIDYGTRGELERIMRSPVDELSRKNNSHCSVECSFLRNSVISQWISKVETSMCQSRSQLSNAVLESHATRITREVISFEAILL